MKGLILAAVIGSVSHVGLATEVWNGSGKVFSTAGQEQDQFNVKVEVDDHGSGQETLAIEVYLSSGTLIKNCDRQKQGKSWTVTCDDGQGYGVCLDLGQCQEYFIADDGQHQATTITKDGNYMRLLTTILESGQAVGFISQSLVKQ
jgi:hypothetical protein